MTTALLVMTDGRACVHHAIESANASLQPAGEIIERYLHDDSGDMQHSVMLAEMYPEFIVIAPPERQGFGGAIRNAWEFIREMTEAEFVFHLEDDFVFNREIDLLGMQTVLRVRPNVCQVALRRQPWNDEERRVGGVVELNHDSYDEHTFIDASWLEHTNFFTTNPSIYRRDLISLQWPEGAQSEGRFGLGLKATGHTFAYWGSRGSGNWVEHVGDQRMGTGY